MDFFRSPLMSYASDVIYDFVVDLASPLDCSLTIGYQFGDGGYLRLKIYNSNTLVEVKEEYVSVQVENLAFCMFTMEMALSADSPPLTFHMKESAGGEERRTICNCFVFLASMDSMEIRTLMDLIWNEFHCTSEYSDVDVINIFDKITQYIPIDIQFSVITPETDAIKKMLEDIRYGDVRGACAMVNGKNQNNGVLMEYTVPGASNNSLQLMLGTEYSCLVLYSKDQRYYLSMNTSSSMYLKHGIFGNMFTLLGCNLIDPDTFIDEVMLTFLPEFGMNEDMFIDDLTEFLGAIKYDTKMKVKRTSVYYDIDGHYWTDRGYSPVPGITVQREKYLTSKANIIKKWFKGWQARKAFAWNPETTLGKYYVNKQISEDLEFMAAFVPIRSCIVT